MRVHKMSGISRGFHGPVRCRNNDLHINKEEQQNNVFFNLHNKTNSCTCRPIKYVLSHNINHRVSIAFATIIIRAALQQQYERSPCDTHLYRVNRVCIDCRQQYSQFCWFLTTKFYLY